MIDIWTDSKRSEVMSKIQSSENRSTELRLVEVFRANKITGRRRHQKVFGNPNFVFRAKRLCVFFDGCLWHGCSEYYRRPQSNQDYWDAKVQRNKNRNLKVNKKLEKIN